MGSDMTSHNHRGSRRETSTAHRFRRGSSTHPAIAGSDVRLSLPARPDSLGVIRHVLGAFAEALRLPPDLIEDIRLAVTEACTNVVRHAYDGEDGPIDVVVRPSRDRLEIVISDRGRGMAPSPDIEGPGLGLPLIAALADSVELQETSVAGSRLKMAFECRPRLGVV
jgi:anti-sigma regulatory factor (Ser/Thr protein kinase)